MASFGRFTSGAGGVVETLSYTSPTLSLTQSAGTSPLTATIAGGGVDGSGTANFVSKWSDTDTLADSLFYSDADIAKTIYGGNDQGLYLDFDNQSYLLGDSGINGTSFLVDVNLAQIKTRNAGADKGLYINFVSNIYALGLPESNDFLIDNIFGLRVNYNNGSIVLGDEAGLWNYAQIVIDSPNQIIKTKTDSDKGLYINLADNIYSLGISETGDPSGEPIAGFNANLTTAEYSMGDAGGYLSDGYIQLLNAETRLYIETNRTHLRNLTQEQIGALSAPLEGDIVYNVSSHHINYYNGTAWRRLLDGAQ